MYVFIFFIFTSSSIAMGFRGITRKWTGACKKFNISVMYNQYSIYYRKTYKKFNICICYNQYIIGACKKFSIYVICIINILLKHAKSLIYM